MNVTTARTTFATSKERGCWRYVALALGLVHLAALAQPVAPVRWAGNGHWYECITVPAQITWEDARIAAAARTYQGMTGYLATATSEAENTFIASIVPSDLWSYYLGGFQPVGSPEPAGNWQWVTGEPWSYTAWQPPNPNNNTGNENAISVHGPMFGPASLGTWNDLWGGTPQPAFIVEYEPQPVAPIRWAGNGHWYECITVPAQIIWEDARIAAAGRVYQGMTGHLATATSEAENTFIASIVPLDLWSYYLGGFQPVGSPEPAGNWQWVTGEPWSYTAWQPPNPNNNTGNENAISVHGPMFGPTSLGMWNDLWGGTPQPAYIVEYEAISIQQPPASQVVLCGQAATFEVAASGSAPLGYRWFKNGIELAGQRGATLVLNSVRTTDAGDYTVEVSNAFGSLRSPVAHLTVNVADVTIALHAGVHIQGLVGNTYTIEATASLEQPAWVEVGRITLSAPEQTWFDPQPATKPGRFYRVKGSCN